MDLGALSNRVEDNSELFIGFFTVAREMVGILFGKSTRPEDEITMLL